MAKPNFLAPLALLDWLGELEGPEGLEELYWLDGLDYLGDEAHEGFLGVAELKVDALFALIEGVLHSSVAGL